MPSKEWYAKNREKDLETQRLYREKNREQILSRRRLKIKSDPEKAKADQKRWDEKYGHVKRERRLSKYAERRKRVLEHYSGEIPACACCGENFPVFLTIDHVNGGGNLQRKSLAGNDIYKHIIASGFPEGYRVLCVNCNLAVHHFNQDIDLLSKIMSDWDRGKIPWVSATQYTINNSQEAYNNV